MFVSFDLLPEARDWKVGKTYRVKMVLKQTSESEEGASFDIVDASSLEPAERGKSYFMTEGGTLKA